MELYILSALIVAVFLIYIYYDKLQVYNPFIKEFYLSKERVINYAASFNDRNLEFANYLEVLLKENFKKEALFKLNVVEVSTNSDAIVQTINNNTDFGVATEFELYNNDLSKLGYISSLYDAHFMVLSTNSNATFMDFNEIENNRKCRVCIGLPNSMNNIFSRKIIALCGINIDNVVLYEVDDETLIKEYGNSITVALFVSSYTNEIIKTLCNNVESHFIPIKMLNDGNLYSKTNNEKQIYTNNPYMHKSLISYQDAVLNFPKLTRLNERQNYISSVKTRYVLFSNINIDPQISYYVINTIATYIEMLKNENYLEGDTIMDLSFTLLNMQIDKGVRRFYIEKNIIIESTTIPECIRFNKNTKCPKTLELTGRLVDINVFNV
jgi:TRAP-type uncharacterized transport system substrate-binding protein|uniref:SsuA/THI5-like domain-containing protein n=1 Tax=viral metagenome TaxID=1070528 RepID=A0A6C0J1W2_9ZZZZ